MSLSSTPTLKAWLTAHLGPTLSPKYFDALSDFFNARVSRDEFSEAIHNSAAAASAASDRLMQVHNALIISLFDATTHHRRSGDGDHHQEEGIEDDGMWSDKLRKWVIGMGRVERERIKSLAMLNSAPAAGVDDEGGAIGGDTAAAAPFLAETDEINMERAVVYLPERGEPPGVRRPMSLAVLTRAPTVQHIADRVNLISAQHDLAAPSKDVASLLLLALEAKIKQLVTHALTLTQSGLSIQSIPTISGAASSSGRVLSIDALDTLFTVSPSDLPQGSAAVMTRLSLGDDRGDDVDGADLLLIRDREVSDQRWQVMALLAERSAVRESLQTRPRV
ncbi:transcriptional regulator of RNA polII, SAGA, subunit-domain-containing protein [Pterulicium gracile]|uniref:Transcriptional regulator of RNA polII, SAGA, subunit-domain-containing protein n=1 Tax=Pterulicium gracile TaxID=1884261 RepID=A0A5C3QTR0_9AGAR|nr:transcriptional regulator of RNA polII, SAGA, subunit-domain-containing protein [Pterula gracilis]